MGHMVKNYVEFDGEVDDALGQWNYGAWLKASPLKRRRDENPLLATHKTALFQDKNSEINTHNPIPTSDMTPHQNTTTYTNNLSSQNIVP